MSVKSRARVWCTDWLSVMILFFAGSVAAQVPKEYKNLQVLPMDIESGELTELMQSFTSALGVRCEFCHVGEPGAPLSEFDFPSDNKPNKETARSMLRMTREINLKYFSKDRTTTPGEVRCVTCHHGQSHPRTIEDVLSRTLDEKGIDAAIAKYRDLRERYYGGHVYDFRENVLTRYARQLASDKKVPEAIEFLKLNAEFYPDSGMVYFMLGELYFMSGNKDAAIPSYEKAVELAPDNKMAKRKLDMLKRQQQ